MTGSLSRRVSAAWLGARTAATVPRVVAGAALNGLLGPTPDRGLPSRGAAYVATGSQLVPSGAERPDATPPSTTPALQPAARASDASWAIVVAFTLIRHFACLPGARWRNTCLHRAVAECLILRSYGAPAVVRIGVARGTREASAGVSPSLHTTALPGPAPVLSTGVTAHAWVECPGVRCFTASGGERDAYALLNAPA